MNATPIQSGDVIFVLWNSSLRTIVIFNGLSGVRQVSSGNDQALFSSKMDTLMDGVEEVYGRSRSAQSGYLSSLDEGATKTLQNCISAFQSVESTPCIPFVRFILLCTLF